jgi:hypothetical protein
MVDSTVQHVLKFGFNWIFWIFAFLSGVEPKALAHFYFNLKVVYLCFALFYAGLGSKVEPIKIRFNLNDMPFIDHLAL